MTDTSPTSPIPISTWTDISSDFPASACNLLLGNGFSISINADFNYKHLCDMVRPKDQRYAALFEKFGDDPERILRIIEHSATLAHSIGEEPIHGLEALKEGIGGHTKAAITAVHPRMGDITSELQHLNERLRDYRSVFTTNYDQLLYWSILARPQHTADMGDGFGKNNKGELVFSAGQQARLDTTIYYLHGGFQFRRGSGCVVKIGAGPGGNLLDNADIAEAVVVLEGTHEQKRAKIEETGYLRMALERLRTCTLPLVIAGHSLADNDGHIAEAIECNPDRRVAVSVYGRDLFFVTGIIATLRKTYEAGNLRFFDSATHPLFNL